MKTLYGIKNCDSVKKARQWLDKHEVVYQFHDFRSDGLSREQILFFLDHSNWETLLNKRSTSWRKLDDAQKTDLNAEKVTRLLLEIPTLIKRPLLVSGKQFFVGFNAASYQTLL